MVIASELTQVGPGLFIWQAYDPEVKAELFSTAISTPDGDFFVDPIPLADPAFKPLAEHGVVSGIIITNANHLRASCQLAEQFQVPIFAQPASFPEAPSRFIPVRHGTKIGNALNVIAIDGAAPGEIVLQSDRALIFGDALINFEPLGFTFLPPKYCSNQKEMRRSLQQLVNLKPERLLFAHGLPILSKATARLQQLLTS